MGITENTHTSYSLPMLFAANSSLRKFVQNTLNSLTNEEEMKKGELIELVVPSSSYNYLFILLMHNNRVCKQGG